MKRAAVVHMAIDTRRDKTSLGCENAFDSNECSVGIFVAFLRLWVPVGLNMDRLQTLGEPALRQRVSSPLRCSYSMPISINVIWCFRDMRGAQAVLRSYGREVARIAIYPRPLLSS